MCLPDEDDTDITVEARVTLVLACVTLVLATSVVMETRIVELGTFVVALELTVKLELRVAAKQNAEKQM